MSDANETGSKFSTSGAGREREEGQERRDREDKRERVVLEFLEIHVAIPMNSGVPVMIFGFGLMSRSWATPKSMILIISPPLSLITMFSG